jgi:hypothetical protein
MKMIVFSDVAPCSLIETDQSFRDAYCLHDQIPLKHRSTAARLYGAISQKTANFILHIRNFHVKIMSSACDKILPLPHVQEDIKP